MTAHHHEYFDDIFTVISAMEQLDYMLLIVLWVYNVDTAQEEHLLGQLKATLSGRHNRYLRLDSVKRQLDHDYRMAPPQHSSTYITTDDNDFHFPTRISHEMASPVAEERDELGKSYTWVEGRWA